MVISSGPTIGRRSLLLAGAAFPVAARAQCVTDTPAVDACRGGVRITAQGPPGQTLDLSFMTPGTLDGRITFTRASIGTYFDVAGVLQTATTNTPRWDYDPVTHVMRGLLIEEQRINSMLQSGDFTNAAWNKGNCTLSAGTTGPNGAVTGSGIISANGATGLLSQNFTAVAGTTYTASCFVKAASSTTAAVTMPAAWWADAINRTATFNLATGQLSSATGGTATGAILPAGNGWYRISVTAVPDTAASGAVRVPWITAPVGDGVTTQVYAFGAQLEVGAFVTSYIPTTAAAVTRSADVATMPTAAWFNAAAGSVEVDLMLPQVLSTGSNIAIIALDQGATTDTLEVRQQGASTLAGVISFTAGANKGGPTTANSFAASVVSKVGFAYTASSLVVTAALNSGAVASATTTGLPTPTRVTFGTGRNTPLNGYLRRVQYWPRALTNAELQQVTT